MQGILACQPQRVATIYGQRRRTWREVGERVPRMASALRALGIADGRLDGYLYVADRVKDMLVSGDENFYSVEVERMLFMHPAVREAAVIGIPSAEWGESVHAVVVLKDGASARAEELMAFYRQHIGGYKCPRSVELRADALPVTPVTPVGKVRRNVLREPC